jgi:hypothetical protein
MFEVNAEVGEGPKINSRYARALCELHFGTILNFNLTPLIQLLIICVGRMV